MKTKMKTNDGFEKLTNLWLPLAAAAVLIFFLSGIPDLKSGFQCDFLLRKIAHMTEYFLLTFLCCRALQHSFNLSNFQLFLYPTAFSLLYSMSDEIHQLFVWGRHGCFQDVLIDSIGILGFYLAKEAFTPDTVKN